MRTDGLEEAGAPLESWLSASQDAARMSGRLAAPQGTLPSGTVVGEWELTGFLGRGGSAEVYCARHLRLGTPAALKVLHRLEEGPKGRFDREVRFLMSNPGPSFPAFYGAGVHGERPWMAMELLEDYPPPGDDAGVAAYLLDVAAGVAVLHGRGWLHRDLKPANILRRADGHAVLADFGLLRPIGEDPAERAATGGLESVVDGREAGVGTPGYSAPEQFSGGDLTPATDVFALGMLADECFGGKPPRVWERIIRRATAFLPRQRYADPLELAHAVKNRFWRRNAVLVVAVVLAAVALGGGLFGGLRKTGPTGADEQRMAAVRRAEETDHGKAVVKAIIDDLVPVPDPAGAIRVFAEGQGIPPDNMLEELSFPKMGLIGRHEVTQAQWEALMESNPSRFQGADLPVDNVTIAECLEFMGRLNRMPEVRESGLQFRFPTEMEWSLSAARDPNCIPAVMGSNIRPGLSELPVWGWFQVNSGGTTHPVGQKTASAAGLFDVWGNVAEPLSPAILDGSSSEPSFYGFACRGGSIMQSQGPTERSDNIRYIGGDVESLPEEFKKLFEGKKVAKSAQERLSPDDPRRLTTRGETLGLRLCADQSLSEQELP